ncbi:MAG: diaminopimelate epimerase [Spirochaetaceae bacterium]|nr:diaminopimelate epimerase [Spirochaetaceae bacterium]
MQIHFHKYQALGNDYMVIDPRDIPFIPSAKGIRYLCDRNRGVGSDGLLFGPLLSLDNFPVAQSSNTTTIIPKEGSFLSGAIPCVRIFNPDGSEAEKSGNGLRIFSLYLAEQGYVDPKEFSVATQGGTVRAGLKSVDPPSIWIDMGEPSFSASRAGLLTDKAEFIHEKMDLNGETFNVSFVSMGNPHCVIFVDDPTPALARRLGPLVEHNQLFPERSNVQFAKVLDDSTLKIEVWERGAGYTLASGSSSCAVAAVARRLGLIDTDKEVNVMMPGGSLTLDVSRPSIVMTGPASKIYEGSFSLSILKMLAQVRALGWPDGLT